MKRFFSLFVAIIATISLFANMQGHFFMNVADENVQVTNVESKFAQWLDLPANTTFVQFRDETDNIGIRHISYQQYVNKEEITNGIVLVHAKNDKVVVVNGDIMDATVAAQHVPQKISPLKAAQKVRKNAKVEDAELKIVRAVINGKDVYRYAYEVMADDFTSKQYVDAETGEIIKEVPLVFNADVVGTATTMYNGNQAITCYEKEGYYYLMDVGRNMITLDATFNAYKINYDNNDDTQELNNLIDGCSPLYNTSTQWSSSWKMQLSQLVIEYVVQNDSWYTFGEGTPDIYIKVKNEQGTVIYTSSHYDDPSFPLTINISSDMNLSQPPYTVELWDYDPIGGDDFIDLFNIYYIFGDNRDNIQWVGAVPLTRGTYSIHSNGKQPHLDAHWGMEKTIDFYQETLNRNSFDNNGAIVYNIVNQPRDTMAFSGLPNNAFALASASPYPMVYGMGTNMPFTNDKNYRKQCMRPLVSIDVLAHEFTHLVTTNNGNGGLEYSGESGALNESFSDIIGIAVKKYATGKNDWMIGSDIMIYYSNMRSMRDPHNSEDGDGAQPKYYNEQGYWLDPTNTTCETCDNGGVHTNSGVQNYWFYLLSEGGSGTNDIGNAFSVIGIGIDKAVQIAYRNLIYYLTPEATFEDSRNGSIQAAIDLYGKDSQEHQSVVNAWYAVGVGDKYTAQVDPITIKAKMPSNWGSTISAWAWEDGMAGSWVTLSKNGEWYSYTSSTNPLNIVFVNGKTWNGDNNQSVDITLSESACIQLNNNSGKRTYSVIDCDKTQDPTEYYIVAKRNSGNYYFFTPNKVDGKNRLIAVDAGTSERTNIDTIHTTADYLWTFEDGKLKNHNGQYLACTDVKSAIMNSTGTVLTKTDNSDGSVTFSYLADTETRYLSLASSGNDYYVFYANTNQFTHLLMLPKGQESTTPIPIVDANPQAQKILRNGQILILRGDKIYTLHGQEVN